MVKGKYLMLEPPDYDTLEKIEWRNNTQDVKQRLRQEETNIMKRIETYCWRFGNSLEEVQVEILNNDMFAAIFAIEPRRTRFHERTALAWLQDHIPGVKLLPNKGPQSLRVSVDGKIIHVPRQTSQASALDFHWVSGETEIYASHIYTRESGGNQNSRFKEVKTLLKRFRDGLSVRNKSLIVIADGPYYNTKRMSELTRLTQDHPPLSFACHIEEVPALIDQYF